jgi:hypothetical protein
MVLFYCFYRDKKYAEKLTNRPIAHPARTCKGVCPILSNKWGYFFSRTSSSFRSLTRIFNILPCSPRYRLIPSASRITIVAKTSDMAKRGEPNPCFKPMIAANDETNALCPEGIPEYAIMPDKLNFWWLDFTRNFKTWAKSPADRDIKRIE